MFKFTYSIHFSIFPTAYIYMTRFPYKFPVSFKFIVFEVTFITTSIREMGNSPSMLFIKGPRAFIFTFTLYIFYIIKLNTISMTNLFVNLILLFFFVWLLFFIFILVFISYYFIFFIYYCCFTIIYITVGEFKAFKF